MIRLLLETATDVCSVALARGEVVVAERTAEEAFKHSSHLTPFIREVLDRAGVSPRQLQEVVLSDGPGSYTSLRVGAATAKGLCVALPGLQLRVVGSLTALATAVETERPVLAVLNSRKGQVFGQLFPGGDRQGGASELRGPHNILLRTDDWWAPYLRAVGGGRVSLVGPGVARVLEHLPGDQRLFTDAAPKHCSASLLLAPAASPENSRIVDVAVYEPYYLNPPFVTKSKKKPLG